MRQVLSALRFVFVSPEFAICLVGTALYMYLPAPLVYLSGRIGSEAELLKYLGLLPAGLVVYDLNVVKNILMPESDKKHFLQKWGGYGDFKLGCVVGLSYAALFTLSGIACFFFNWKTPAAHQSAMLITSVVGAVIDSATLYFAQIKIEELLRAHTSSVVLK